MRITRFLPELATQSLFSIKNLLTSSVVCGCMIITGCGGGGDGKKASSSSSSFSYSFSSVAVSSNGNGTWPSVKVDAPLTKTLSFSWSPVEGASYYRLMKNQGAGFTPVGGNITDTTATDEIAVHLHDWINTRYLVEWCDASDVCQPSNNTYTATEMIKSIGLVQASNGDAGDFFGWSVALSGDGQTLAVGAPAEDSNAQGINGDQTSNLSENSGAVYVFIKENGLWVQQAYLKASNTEQPSINPGRYLTNDRFGYRVAISDDGNTLAVSAIHEDSPSWGVNCNQANYEVTTITAPASSSSTTSSTSTSSASSSLDTNDIYITAKSLDVGAVYVFKRADSVWSQTAYIKPEFSVSHIQLSQVRTGKVSPLTFGETLSISGDGKSIAVGAPKDIFSFIDPENVITFDQSSTHPCLDYATLSNVVTSEDSSSSASSSSSSSSSASSVTTVGGNFSGAVYTFVETESGWKPEAWIKASNADAQITYNGIEYDAGDLFGSSVALSKDGTSLIVGAPGEDSGSVGVNGDKTNTCFYSKRSPLEYDATCSKFLVESVRINNGAAYLFTKVNGSWSQTAYLKPGNKFPYSQFGIAVDISDDGLTLAVGATGDASTLNTIINSSTVVDSNNSNHLNSGAAYIFARTDNTWSQQAFIKPSVSLPNYQFGNEVKLSADGSILAVGSFMEASNSVGINSNPGDTSATGAGAMYIFKRDATQWSQATYVKASDTKAQDRFGNHATLSDDGQTMMVGAHRKAGTASSQSSSTATETAGGVYIY